MENLRLAIELATKREVDDAPKRIRATVADEVQNSMKSGEGVKEQGFGVLILSFVLFYSTPSCCIMGIY